MLGSSLDPGPSVATIQYRYRASESSASIFIHEFDDENDPDIVFPGAEIRVQGNFNKYHYTFFLDDTKIAQVCDNNVFLGETLCYLYYFMLQKTLIYYCR